MNGIFGKKRQGGFTIAELMIVVAVIGVITAVALPSFRSHLADGTRSQAQQVILDISSREHQYMIDARSFTTALDNTGLNFGPPSGWTAPCSAAACVSSDWSVSVAVDNTAAPPTFTVTATGVAGGKNAGETLTATQAGVKTWTPNGGTARSW